jgi:hypothetical protein
MKPPRTALPLPRYTLRKLLKAGPAYFFNPPMWARKNGCPVETEALGTDYDEAVKRAERVLLPALDAWRKGSETPDESSAVVKAGTLDWMFAEYRADRRYKKLSAKHKRNHENGFKLVGGYVLKDGKRLGEKRLTAIDTALADDLYEKLLVLKITDDDGNVVERKRRTTVNHAMKSCRRAWFICARRNPKKVVDGTIPLINPFAKMGLESSDRETPTATYEELQTFRDKAKELGLHSLATAALIGWEWLQRETDIFATFDVTHYRPKDRANMVRVVDDKTDSESWIPLFDPETGVPLYPELMTELDAIKRDRIGGLDAAP